MSLLDKIRADALAARKAKAPEAGGLVIAMDQEHAWGIAQLLRDRYRVNATVAVSEDPQASAKISTFAAGKETIVSRGELVEIGGSFRMPDVMEQAGTQLVGVGATNRTRIADFQNALTPETGMLLKVHTSNYAMVGFTEETPMEELAELARANGLPSVFDLGAGFLNDGVPGLQPIHGLEGEPLLSDAIRSGADVVTFSGDKLFGGPQAGILAGNLGAIEDMRKHPLYRAMRLDKVGLAGLEEALPRLIQAVEAGDTVGIFGDYDADGVTTAALLTDALRTFGAEVVPRVASRNRGYGFGILDAESLLEGGATLIITGDCGTSDLDAIGVANDAGVEVIIIDHHTVPAADEDHPAYALINPFREDSSFPFQGMASVGLAFYVMVALRTELRGRGHFEGKRTEPNPCDWLDLVAMGTVADLVPLRAENRIMTTEGLKRLAARKRPGVAALLDVAGIKRSDKIDERTWRIVGETESDVENGKISYKAPLARALIGKHEGDEVTVPTPGGAQTWEIIEVRYR